MKRFIKIFIVVLVAFHFLVVNSYAINSNIDSYNEEFEIDKVFEAVDDKTANILNEIGISKISYESIFGVSPTKVFNAFFNMFSNSLKANLKYIFICFGFIVITSFMTSVSKKTEIINLLSNCAIALVLAVPVGKVLSLSFSVIDVISNFTIVFTGAFCGIVSASSGAALGSSYGAMSVLANSIFSISLKEVSSPLINAMCSLGFLSCFDSFNFTSKLSNFIKNIYVYILSFIGTIFSGIITIKGVLSSGSDSLSARSVRFVVGKSLPLVGGALSETYSSVVAGLSLIKSTVGVFGIITVCIMVLPAVLEIVLWIFLIDFLLLVSGTIDDSLNSNILNVFKNALTLLLATISINCVIFIVNVGVVIALKGGLE